jgi:hypothetical protein
MASRLEHAPTRLHPAMALLVQDLPLRAVALQLMVAGQAGALA